MKVISMFPQKRERPNSRVRGNNLDSVLALGQQTNYALLQLLEGYFQLCKLVNSAPHVFRETLSADLILEDKLTVSATPTLKGFHMSSL